LKVGKSRRLVKKKFEPTVFAPITKSEHVFFARAIFAHESALPMKLLLLVSVWLRFGSVGYLWFDGQSRAHGSPPGRQK
jgi:hypothetical protein